MSLIKRSAIIGFAIAVTSCSTAQLQQPTAPIQVSSKSATPLDSKRNPSPVPTAKENSAIRSFDFAHLTYPNYPAYSHGGKRRITLRSGQGSPAYLEYGDVTGDGVKEAFAVLGIEIHGTAIPHYVYIYALQSGQPKLLWDFETGDRADGGLRRIYSDQGDLVVELYGKGKVLGTDLYADDGTRAQTPYPYYFTQTRYKWDGTHFKQQGAPVLQSNSQSYGSPLMPLYGPPS
jgi:hypothetical protein